MGSSWAALPTLAVLAAAYVLSQFFRTALAVVAPEIAADLGLDPARLGMLSSAWFWAFAAAQIPIGVALDRWGPRRTVSLVFGVGGLGCLVFARATQLGTAILGQILIGIGCAPVFMGALVILARFYPPHLFAQFSAILLAIGTAGTLAGTTPLALVADAIGWRGAFLGMGALVAVVALLLASVVRDRPPGAADPDRDRDPGCGRVRPGAGPRQPPDLGDPADVLHQLRGPDHRARPVGQALIWPRCSPSRRWPAATCCSPCLSP